MTIKIKKEKLVQSLKNRLNSLKEQQKIEQEKADKQNIERFQKFQKSVKEALKWDFETALAKDFKVQGEYPHEVSISFTLLRDIESLLKTLEMSDDEFVSFTDKSNIHKMLNSDPKYYY